MSRKDSKGMFAAVLGKLEEDSAAQSNAGRSNSPHLLKVAAGVRQMQERSDLAERLLKSGEQVVEFSPVEIVPSLITDRFDEAYEASAITEIIESMRERGQIVPGLVRPAPNKLGSFQIVYGRRRLEAARQLGLPFKALVRNLTDEQAIIFQGEENTAREDLSFIEKSAFALAQQAAGFSRETICASLSTGKSHVSEMIKIASLTPKALLTAIGKAPTVGRGRWEELVRQLTGANPSDLDYLTQRAAFKAASSDARFSIVFDALHGVKPNKAQATKAENAVIWAATDKSVRAKIKDNGKSATIVLEAANGLQFAAYITACLDALYASFSAARDESEGD